MIVVSFLRSLFSPKMQRATVIEHLIETLARNERDQTTYVKFLDFDGVQAYMTSKRARLLARQERPYLTETYEVWLNGNNYEVKFSREHIGVIITSRDGELY